MPMKLHGEMAIINYMYEKIFLGDYEEYMAAAAIRVRNSLQNNAEHFKK